MQQAGQLPNIAPAPAPQQQMQPQPGQPQMAGQAGAAQPGHQLMPQAMGQFQFIQQPFTGPNGQPQYAAVQQPQYAVNQSGQLVALPPGSFMPGPMQLAPQQPGQPQQQYVMAPMPAGATAGPATPTTGQKPGLPHQIVSSPVSSTGAGGKTMQVPMSQASYATIQTGPNGMQQTIIMANPMMGGMAAPAVSAALGQAIATTSSYNKPGDIKPSVSTAQTSQASQIQHQQGAPQTQQPYMMPPGAVAYVNPSQSMYIHNNQLIMRPPAPHDPNSSQPAPQTLMFSPNGQQISQPTPTAVQGSQPQIQPNMSQLQPMAMMQSSPQIRAPVSTITSSSISAPPPGKTAISRSMAPIAPRYTSPASLAQLQPQQPSPKSKQKASPRTGGPIGRPPGPKNVLSALKAPVSVASLSPPSRMPGNSSPLGPPTLQNAVPLQVTQSQVYSHPPVLKPQLPAPLPNSVPVSQPQPVILEKKTTAPSGPPSITSSMPSIATPPQIAPMVEQQATKIDPPSINGGNAAPNLTSESDTPKAIVKPSNVLTNIIDGHEIKESSQPFPVEKNGEKGTNCYKIIFCSLVSFQLIVVIRFLLFKDLLSKAITIPKKSNLYVAHMF